ncbi:MAG: hypothetical protein V4622_01070 [Bacteroidota bacterium]
MKKQNIFLALILTVFIVSCSNDTNNRTSSEYLSAYMKDNKNVVLFGKIDIKQILEKADYKNIPKVSVLLVNEMKQFENCVDLSKGIHFAMEGPFEEDGTPSNLLAFAKVKNQDSLVDKITSLGLMMQESGDMKFAQDNDVSIGIKEHLAIFVTKKGNYDGKKALNDAFDKTENDLSSGKTEQILNQKGDILIGVNMQNLYESSNTSLAKLPKNKRKEFEDLINDSYVQSSISFENGQAIFQTKNLFSQALMKRMFFNEDAQATILTKLGKGNARLGLAMNMDMSKMEHFLDDFAPDFKDGITKANFQMQMAVATLGDKPLTNLLSGKIGLVMVGDMMRDGSLVPEANIHIGLGNKGKDVSEMLKAFFPENQGVYGMDLMLNEKEITLSSGKSTSNKLTIPAFASQFGKKGFTAFINFEGMNLKSMDLDDGAKALYALQYVFIEADNQGSKMIVKGKKANVNILKQIVDVYIEDLENTISGI